MWKRLPVVLGALAAFSAPAVPHGLAAPPLELRGRWVLDAAGRRVGPQEFRRGLQPSGAAWRSVPGAGGVLWCLGDQRGQFPAHVFRLDVASARLVGEPLKLEVDSPPADDEPLLGHYRGIPNPDYEGLCADPTRPDMYFGITEDKGAWLAEIEIAAGTRGKASAALAPRARIIALTEVVLPEGLRPWRESTNFRFEGIAAADDGKTLFLAFERADDELPRVLRIAAEAARKGPRAAAEIVPVRFAAVMPREDKKDAKLNLNDIQFLAVAGRPHLVALARDQERILLVDIGAGAVVRTLDLDLRDASGNPIEWVSPEALAFDAAADRLWIINDPDSERGNYRRRGSAAATDELADFVPLLFETRLSTLLAPEEKR